MMHFSQLVGGGHSGIFTHNFAHDQRAFTRKTGIINFSHVIMFLESLLWVQTRDEADHRVWDSSDTSVVARKNAATP